MNSIVLKCSPKSSSDTNHVGPSVKNVDEQKKFLLSPSMARTNSQGRQRKPSNGSANSNSDTDDGRLVVSGQRRYASFPRGADPPEIVVVAPSSPSTTLPEKPASVLRQHDIM